MMEDGICNMQFSVISIIVELASKAERGCARGYGYYEVFIDILIDSRGV